MKVYTLIKMERGWWIFPGSMVSQDLHQDEELIKAQKVLDTRLRVSNKQTKQTRLVFSFFAHIHYLAAGAAGNRLFEFAGPTWDEWKKEQK